jgi:sec-independent protein translocase protein TatC
VDKTVRGKKKTANAGQVMLDHVRELRLRLFICLLVLIAGSIVGYIFYEPILAWLKSPLVGDLYYSTPAGSFNFILKVATMVGIGLAIPVIVYQLVMFVRPAIAEVLSRARVALYTGLSVTLALIGAAFGFYAILPGALHFFAGFQVEGLSAIISADSYLNFVTNVMITFMLVFQIPLLLVIIDRIKPIHPKQLFKAEKYVILGGLVVSFFVPFALDLMTSLLIALPIVVLYNISVGIIIVRHAYVKRRVDQSAVIDADDLALDDALVAEFFAAPSEKVEAVKPAVISESRPLTMKNLAMDFQKSRQASLEELRNQIQAERAAAIAAKVAKYNTPDSFRRIISV